MRRCMVEYQDQLDSDIDLINLICTLRKKINQQYLRRRTLD